MLNTLTSVAAPEPLARLEALPIADDGAIRATTRPEGTVAALLAALEFSAACRSTAMPFSQHCCAGRGGGTREGAGAVRVTQKPEKTRALDAGRAARCRSSPASPFQVTVPVVRLKAIGSEPIEVEGSGGQSWLVG
jgi:hypothetical protein